MPPVILGPIIGLIDVVLGLYIWVLIFAVAVRLADLLQRVVHLQPGGLSAADILIA